MPAIQMPMMSASIDVFPCQFDRAENPQDATRRRDAESLEYRDPC